MTKQMSDRIFLNKWKIATTRVKVGIIGSHRKQMPQWEYDSNKDLQSKKLEWRPGILVKLNFENLCNSNLSGLHIFDNITLSLC